jgi:hypothetical protein
MADLDGDIDRPESDEASERIVTSDAKQGALTTQNPHVARIEVDHVQALARYHRGWTKDRYNIEHAYEDLNFLAGVQWDSTLATQRIDDGRPVLTFNRMGQFVRQVTGNMRKMRPAIKVVPTHAGADEAIAEIREGLIRHIENASDAALDVYVDGADSQVASGIGHWEVAGEYNLVGEQDLILRTLDDQVAVIWDPDARKKDRSDAVFCFVPVDMTREAYKDTYPDHAIDDIGTESGYQIDNWYDDDRIRVARYWYKIKTKIKMMRMPDGTIQNITEPTADDQATPPIGGEEFEVDGFEIWHRMMNCVEFLTAPKKWSGRYIPVIPIIGEEIKVGSRRERHGIVRFAADPQRAYNYARSTQTEFVGLQPKSPFVGTEENFKDYSEEWDTANVKNWPYLRYTPDPKNGSAAPQRQAPPTTSPGLTECIADAAADMQAVVGIYNASLGAQSNETSGVAINSREQQGDTGTFVYMANFALSITQTARVINDLIPYFYDTARTIHILGPDGKSRQVAINQPKDGIQIDGAPVAMENDITVGIYDIQMEMGPSYQTQREEARNGMTDFIKAFPQAAPLIADKIAKAQDWPEKDDVAERLQTLLPPAIQAQIAKQDNKPPPAPPPPDPVKMAEAQALVAKSHGEMARSQADVTKSQAQSEISGLDVKKKEMELVHQSLLNMKAEMELVALQSTMGQNGPPIDQAKLHDFVNKTDEMLRFLGAHVAAQIAAEAPQAQQAASQPSQGLGQAQTNPAPPSEPPEQGAPQEAAPSEAQ